MKKLIKNVAAGLLTASFVFTFMGCNETVPPETDGAGVSVATSTTSASETQDSAVSSIQTTTPEPTETPAASTEPPSEPTPTLTSITLDDIPAYTGEPYVIINDNTPFFTNAELTTTAFEEYSPLDTLGRCGPTYACVGTETMPTEERGSIGQVKPSGWHTIKYDFIDGKYLFNRCHLIGYQLTAENSNERNLITGTRALNILGMLPFENMTADYIKETGNHVLYRVTQMFQGNDLVAEGVLMEAKSVEDDGTGILFCVFCYNVQPGVVIDYATGDSYADGSQADNAEPERENMAAATPLPEQGNEPATEASTYILNTNTKRFHYPSCSSVDEMKDKNKQEYTGTRDELIAEGYKPCGRCKP